ncbi:helix-turn-helix domain-containing protein [Paenibacillus sp. FA6]|uniref:helix-turn-helix domain-containing protein n=1 Tax=Paenibacillus sp. FA6 TaxID=3413029 RepID=UPI003F65584A
MSEQIQMAITIINQIITMQSADNQRLILSDLFSRFGWLEKEEYQIMTDEEVAKRFGVTVRTVQDWLLSGELNGFKEARKWYSRTDWVREFENSKSSEPRIKAILLRAGT